LLFDGERALEAKKEGAIGKMNKFEVGKYYIHSGGRKISIVGEVMTDRWKEQFVVEEVDKTGHAISCMDIDAERNENWLEIGHEEWMRNFK